MSMLDIGAVVPDHEQLPAFGEPGSGPLHHRLHLLLYQMEVGDQHEVEDPIGLPGENVAHFEAHTVRRRSASFHRHVGKVHGCHLPAKIAQPDGIAALARGEVQTHPRLDDAQAVGNKEVWPCRPEAIGGAVSLVPF